MLLTMHLSKFEFNCVSKVKSDRWSALASYTQYGMSDCLHLYKGIGNLGEFSQPFKLYFHNYL